MNDINFQLNTRQTNKKTAEETGGWGGGVEKQWAAWLNIPATATHAKQIKTQKKYMQIPA